MAIGFEGFRSLIECSSDATSLIDANGKILYASASAMRIFGCQPEELVGRNGLRFVHPGDRPHVSSAMKELLATCGGTTQWNARIRRKEGNWLWTESTASNMLCDPTVRAIAINHRNIEARKTAEAKARQDGEEMIRANLILEEFAYTVAHDLREPLRTMSAFTELLILKTEMDEKTKEIAGLAVGAAARMTVLLSDLLSLATTNSEEEPVRVDLGDAVTEAIQNLARGIETSGAVIAVDPLPPVCGDVGHLVRVFQNLIGNALKYRGEERPEIHVSADRRGREWVIRVRDNGIGIAPEQYQRIFQLSTRLHGREIPGTGIGLAVCKKIIERAGGRIWVESGGPGSGSTFCFTTMAIGETHQAAAGANAPQMSKTARA
jgi:PAS domain S-box-containing protein